MTASRSLRPRAGLIITALFLGLSLILPLVQAPPAQAGRPKYVFYFIGDGLGAAQRQLGEYFLQEQSGDRTAKLIMNTFEVAGMTTTHSADSLVTDSAAAGTALASGVKTNTGVIGKDTAGQNVRTLTEAARDAGMRTGIITTTRLTHATPATFAAHNISRDNENDIALDLLASGVDFLAGGGARHFIPQGVKVEEKDPAGRTIKSKREDDRDLVREFKERGYATFVGMAGTRTFKATNFSTVDKSFAAFTYSHLPYEIDRCHRYPEMPSLADMTRAGIDALTRDGQGFFLVVEGGRIDHACHSNDPAAAAWDILAFDAALETVLAFYKAHPSDTLILVVGDHETGGLGLGSNVLGDRLNMAALMPSRISVGDTLSFGAHQYTGDRAAFVTVLNRDLGLADLTDAETARLTAAFDAADAGERIGAYKVNPAAFTAARLLSERANIGWTATIHTGTMIPLSAKGREAARFGGYKDNTDIALTLADLLGLKL